MDNTNLVLRFTVAIGLGILLGLERERTKGGDGGARSQPDPVPGRRTGRDLTLQHPGRHPSLLLAGHAV